MLLRFFFCHMTSLTNLSDDVSWWWWQVREWTVTENSQT